MELCQNKKKSHQFSGLCPCVSRSFGEVMSGTLREQVEFEFKGKMYFRRIPTPERPYLEKQICICTKSNIRS